MQPSPQFQVPEDVVNRLYLTAESMLHLADTLPEEQGGLANIIGRLGKDVECCAVLIDDAGK